jgi:hypothetical protein
MNRNSLFWSPCHGATFTSPHLSQIILRILMASGRWEEHDADLSAGFVYRILPTYRMRGNSCSFTAVLGYLKIARCKHCSTYSHVSTDRCAVSNASTVFDTPLNMECSSSCAPPPVKRCGWRGKVRSSQAYPNSCSDPLLTSRSTCCPRPLRARLNSDR